MAESFYRPRAPSSARIAPIRPVPQSIPMARTKSSGRWLQRHVNDPYVKQAQRDGYRSRAAYKLIELNEKDRLIRPGMRVMDLGSAPGGWSQVLSRLLGAKGRVLATDILPMDAVQSWAAASST